MPVKIVEWYSLSNKSTKAKVTKDKKLWIEDTEVVTKFNTFIELHTTKLKLVH